MNAAITSLHKMASGKTVFIAFILTNAVYALMMYYTLPKVESFAPGIALFDLSPSGYSYQHAISLLGSLGESGRNVYLFQQLPLDFIYPGLFAISYSLMLIWLFAKSFNTSSRVFYVALIPMLAGLFDYLENISIILMIKSFPGLSQGLVGIASTFTILKSVFSGAFFLLLFVGILSLAVSRIKRKPGEA